MFDLNKEILNTPLYTNAGRVIEASESVIRASLPEISIGDLVEIERCDKSGSNRPLLAKVVGFKHDLSILFPFETPQGIKSGAKVRSYLENAVFSASEKIIGTVINSKGEILYREKNYYPQQRRLHTKNINITHQAPLALERKPITERLITGISAIDAVTPIGKGQRLGIFAEPGVGKSNLISAIATNAHSDINIIALIGERGREVSEFIFETLSPEARGRSIVVVSTSDEPAIMRANAALLATSIAEYYREQGLDVLFLLDSLSRYCRALRDIGLVSGENPIRRGYPPSVFAKLPQLLERAGNCSKGTMTALYTLLVSEDLDQDPIVEEAKGILDGHIELKRALAERGHFPAIDLNKSISRLTRKLLTTNEQELREKICNLFFSLENEKETILFGGEASADLNHALKIEPALNLFLRQKPEEGRSLEVTYQMLKSLLQESI